MTTQTTCYIHGLNSSQLSFAFILAKADKHDFKCINYQSHQPLEESIQQVSRSLPKGPLILVGHSLGGVIAMTLAHLRPDDVKKVVTISAPLGGSRAALYLKYFARGLHVIGDITPVSPCILALQNKSPCPVLSIVSTGGHLPTTSEPNDSVVTVRSQNAITEAKKVEVNANHFEVLNHMRTVEAISKFING